MSKDEEYPPKSEWGDGPWQNEPDREDFEHAGFACLALRNYFGAWCGYVGVPKDHPAFGQGYDSLAVDVHGGLTYTGECCEPICHTPKPGYPEHVWWVGFDCSHAFDLSPGHAAFYRRCGFGKPMREEVYRDLEYVKGQIRGLAEQLAAMAATHCVVS